jgi:predicted Zn-dependent peptidase
MRGNNVTFSVSETSSNQSRQSLVSELRKLEGVAGITRASHSTTHKLGRLYIVSFIENVTPEQIAAVIAKLKEEAQLVESIASKDPRRC